MSIYFGIVVGAIVGLQIVEWIRRGIFRWARKRGIVARGVRFDDFDLINQIEDVRRRNNVRWMDIVRVAMRHAPDDTRAILRDIQELDGEVRRLTQELAR